MRSTLGVGARRPLFAVAGPITSACGESQSQQQRESNMSGQLMRSKIRKMEFNRLCWEKAGNSADTEPSRRLSPRPHSHRDWQRQDVFYTCAGSRARPTDVQPGKHPPKWAFNRKVSACRSPESIITVIFMLLCSYYITFRHLTCNSHQSGSFSSTVSQENDRAPKHSQQKDKAIDIIFKGFFSSPSLFQRARRCFRGSFIVSTLMSFLCITKSTWRSNRSRRLSTTDKEINKVGGMKRVT